MAAAARKVGTRRLQLAAIGARAAACFAEVVALRCLIVDDNEQFLTAARDRLEGDGIMIVGQASSGAGALERARDLRPDVTLLDIDLRDESGFDIARRLVDADASGAAAIVLISAYARADFEELIAGSPIAGFVAKSDLSAAAIREVLGGADDAGGV